MRIDSHQHFWKYDPVRDAWITEEMAILKKDYVPEQLIPELLANGIDGCVAVQADQSEAETLFLLEMANRNSEIRGVVGWTDLCAENVAERLRFFSQYKKLCGFRHIVQAEPDDRFMLRDSFVRGISCLREFDFTYDILVYPHQLPAAIKLAAKFTEQRFVVDHIAKPPMREKRTSPWAQHMRQIAQCSNVHCKLSGLITEADWQHWSGDDFKPYLDVVFEAFGIDRLMFGSDWPVCLLAGSYSQVVQLIADYTQKLAARDREKLFGLNAVNFYRLES